MTTDPNAITARVEKEPAHEKEPGTAESKAQPGSRLEIPIDRGPATAASETGEHANENSAPTGKSELESDSARSGQSHLKYMALVSKSGAAKPAVEGAPSGKTEAARDEPPASSQSASIAQIGGG